MPAALFVNTTTADYKLVIRLLLYLRDWEYGEDPTWDNFHLIITTEVLPISDDACCTKPPITENDLSSNIWANKSIADIESFMLKECHKEIGWNLNTFIILDEQGVKDGTTVLLDMPFGEGDGVKLQKKFNKVRVPWEKTYIMWCNLDIANMDFEDFVEDEDTGVEVEWWTYRDYSEDQDEETQEAKDVTEKRHNAIVELEQQGMA